MPLPVLLALLSSAALPTIAGDCHLAAAPTGHVRVLELYTSEGCNSCPPADRWLRGLDPRGELVVAAFHVDYWDRLGWRDPWSDARFSARQHWRAGRTGARVVYTPDVVFEGRSRNDWSRGWTPAAATAAAPFALAVEVSAGGGGRLRVAWDSADAPAGSQAWIAITQSGLASTPTRGENAGSALGHDHVVRAFAAALDGQGGSQDLVWPADLDPASARVNLVIEDAAAARPLHAATISLAGCRIER